MGTEVGIGMDMVESENVPSEVLLKDENELPKLAKKFSIGQNSQIIQDLEDDIYMVGQKIQYTPKKLNFDPEILDTKEVDLMACGRKHYVLVTRNNKILVWGDMFKDKVDKFQYSEGFNTYDGNVLFDDGKIKQLDVKYNIFGALVEH